MHHLSSDMATVSHFDLVVSLFQLKYFHFLESNIFDYFIL